MATAPLESIRYELLDEHDQVKNKFAGGLVEIHGLPGPVSAFEKGAAPSQDSPLVDVNEAVGRAFWLESEGKYLVHLRNDLFVHILEENLRDWEPPICEDGGFDLLWPSSTAGLPGFSWDVAKMLSRQGWCLVECIVSEQTRKDALQQARGLEGFHGPKRELMVDYLGRGGSGKITTLPEVLVDPATGQLPTDPLSSLDFKMEELAAELAALAPSFMDTRCAGRSPSTVWLPFEDRAETQRLRGEPISEEDVDAGLLEDHLTFIRHRKLGFMWLVENDGGDLLLFPREDIAELQPVRLPVSTNKLLIYRADWMTFSYKPRSPTKSLVLQTWLLEEPPEMTIQNLVGSTELRSKALGIHKGPPQPVGDRMHAMSCAIRTSGCVGNLKESSMLYGLGTDSFIEIPKQRFDVDVYCPLDGMHDDLGVHYSQHAAFDLSILEFDNKFFNMSDIACASTAPGQFMVLEVGYTCLHNSGFTRRTMRGHNIGVYMGDVGTDFGYHILDHRGDEDFVKSIDDFKHISAGVSKHIVCTRLSYSLHLKGPTQNVDSACSASLLAVTLAAQTLRQAPEGKGMTSVDRHLTEMMPMGVNTCLHPAVFIMLAAGQMNSPTGRCQTFNDSADGYARGEATAALHLKMSDSDEDVQSQMACLLGAKSNQDGRSANLTAPNGPAQQAVVRESMREAGLQPNQINIAECHGTGTALGDPIEVGALRGVMEPRMWPLATTSAKSNIGHCEASAGIVGLLKCVGMLNHAASTPNCHLCELNVNLEMHGFPAYFNNETLDVGLNSGVSGVSSFGMGGTNARGDMWQQARAGPYKTERMQISLKTLGSCLLQVTCPVTLGPIDYLTGEPMSAIAPEGVDLATARRRRSDVLRDTLEPYDISRNAYNGGFRYRLNESMDEFDEDVAADKNVRICGSWSGWKRLQKLEPAGGGWYSAVAALGESRCESFFFCVGKHRDQRIYPVAKNASPLIHVVGPDSKASGRKWMIDGRDMEVPAGTLYHIRFRWGNLMKQVHWEQLNFEPEHPLPQYEHGYAIVGSFNSWSFQDLYPIPDKVNTWEGVARIGNSGCEEFKFLRDRDWDQAIYPAWQQTSRPGVPVRGPDDMGEGKSWVVHSRPNSNMRCRLTIVDGDVTVEVHVEDQKPRMWQSISGWDRHQYYTIGSWNDWKPVPMIMDPDQPGLFRCRVTFFGQIYSSTGLPLVRANRFAPVEYFRVVVDRDVDHAWYPQEANALSGKQITHGPDGKGSERYWMLQVPAGGGVFEINLDLTMDDRRRIVTWFYISQP